MTPRGSAFRPSNVPTFRLFLAASVLGLLGYFGARGLGVVPPLGPFLDPANGVWALARAAELPERSRARIPGLSAPVEVRYDDRGVPHIFAATEVDAWRAQGYVVARDRLFQLELQSRAASGTLSELLGKRALEADRTDRRRGFPWAAERGMAALDSSSLIARAARAYADGVNAWIDALRPAELPLEYRLLNARPVRWHPIDTFYLYLQMGLTLAWEDPTLTKLQARAMVGAAAAEALFPLNSPIQEPIQPNGTAAPRYDFARLPPPGPPDSLSLIAAREREQLNLDLAGLPHCRTAALSHCRTEIGSNNWVVAPSRTAAGFALLAGDPHLELSLPSVWYEVHLQVAGGLDVAGVTFPGSPGVIIGFNRDVAWSFTNTGADVRDHYEEQVDDPAEPTRYRLDGAWQPLETRLEAVRDRDGDILAVDTVRFTRRGPLVRQGDRWLSLRWTAFESPSPGEDFLRLNRARSVAEWLDGWKDYVAAAQNGVVADRSGSIAIRSTGKYPLRPGNGRGDDLRDGSSSASDWAGFLPLEAYPFARDPAQGFLASANQQPVDPRVNPHYFGANWYSPWRALRINQLLRADSSVTPEAMRRFQGDAESVRAAAFVPLLRAAARADSSLGLAAALLAEWDYRYAKDSRGAALFDATMAALAPLVWDELIPPDRLTDSSARPTVVPEDVVLLELAGDSSSVWWDDHRTPVVERRDAILAEALRRGFARALREYGSPEGKGWRWDRAHQANVYHLLRIPALSALELPVQGGPSTLTPSPGRGTHGPSWRMVVELGPKVRGWGVYPGGQSGNPASSRYLDRLPRWLAGELDTVWFPAKPDDLPATRVRSRLTLTGADR